MRGDLQLYNRWLVYFLTVPQSQSVDLNKTMGAGHTFSLLDSDFRLERSLQYNELVLAPVSPQVRNTLNVQLVAIPHQVLVLRVCPVGRVVD